MEFAEHLDQLRFNAVQLARSARLAGLDAPVPSCPGWNVRRLVGHVTKVHHRATSILAGGDPQQFEFTVPDDDQLFAVFDAGVAGLIRRLAAPPGATKVWTFLPSDSPIHFWARRQAHETAIHRVDAELAADFGVAEFDPLFAADGLDELLLEFAPDRPATWDVLTEPRTVTVEPTDVNRGWTLTLGAGRALAVPETRDGSDLTVFGTASDLYRWAWNRASDAEVMLRGDLRLADLWRERFNVRS
ncbi:MAG TPA: maleylpyruvate isomerase family mycothiol-dependent enzyme [Jatrophihabitans sp.]|jgi:uncharacterized protein (TIGR03083 family)